MKQTTPRCGSISVIFRSAMRKKRTYKSLSPRPSGRGAFFVSR
jgi:hypothetical protein